MALKPDMFVEYVNRVDPQAGMKAAQAAVRRFAGWHVAPSLRETVTLDGTGHTKLLLKSGHVTEVHSVLVVESGNITRDITKSVRWSENGILEGIRFPARFRSVVVDLTHGYDPEEVPDVLGVLERASVRAMTDPRVRAQSIGSASVSMTTNGAGAVASFMLLSDERESLAPFRLEWGA